MSWIISKALMNSLYSQEPEAESLGECSADSVQSAQLKSTNTAQA